VRPVGKGPSGAKSDHSDGSIGLGMATEGKMGVGWDSATGVIGGTEGRDSGRDQVVTRGTVVGGIRQSVGWGTSTGNLRPNANPPPQQVTDSHEVEVDYNEGGSEEEEGDEEVEDEEEAMKGNLRRYLVKGKTSNKKPRAGHGGGFVPGDGDGADEGAEAPQSMEEGTQPQEAPQENEKWMKVLETDYFPVGDVLLRLQGEVSWNKERGFELGVEWFRLVESEMAVSLRAMVPNRMGLEVDDMASVREGVPNFWMVEEMGEGALGVTGEDWMPLDQVVEVMNGGFIRIQVPEGWLVRCTGQDAGDLIKAAAEELTPLVREFCMDVYKKTEVLVEAAPEVVAASSEAKWAGAWVVVTGLGEGFPKGIANKKDEDRLVVEVMRATRELGDGVTLRVDQDDLVTRARRGKVFFCVRGRDLVT